MNSYWNQSEQERAELTREQVHSFIAVELMEKGVANVEPPTLHEIAEVKLETTTYYSVQYAGEYSGENTGFVFKKPEQAQAFVDAQPLKSDSDWELGSRHYAKPCVDMTVGTVELPAEQDIINSKAKLSETKELKDANEKAKTGYNEARKAINEATAGLWEDWDACCGKKRAAEQVQATFGEYIAMCGGDSTTAAKFLRKVYDDGRISEAASWLTDGPVEDSPLFQAACAAKKVAASEEEPAPAA